MLHNVLSKALLLALAALLIAVPAAAQDGDDEEILLRVMTHDSFNISTEVLEEFEERHNVKVAILRSGDTGSALNQAILSANNPLADVFFGVDNTFLSRALEADIFAPYEPQLADGIPETFIIDPDFHMTPVDYGDVCLNYDVAYFEENELAPPESLEDLVKPEFKGLTVVENPATSSPGLAFLLATIGHFGEPILMDEEGNDIENPYSWEDYWAELVENDVLVVDGWESAYYGEFTVAGEGTRPIVVSYASSPAAEVYYAEEEIERAPTANVLGDGACFRQIEFAGVLRGAEHPEMARAFVDYMLADIFQEDIPLHMFVFPVMDVELPAVFEAYAETPENPAEVPFEQIEANRAAWLDRWTEIALR